MTRDELEALSSRELHHLAVKRALEHVDVEFFWRLLRDIPAAGVVAEAMVALVLAGAALEKFGGDSMLETKRNYDGYAQQVRSF